MRPTNILLALALCCCNIPRHKWWQTGGYDHVAWSSIFVGGTSNQSVPYCPYYGDDCQNSYTDTFTYSDKSKNKYQTCCGGCEGTSDTINCCHGIMSCEDDIRNEHGQPLVCIRTDSDLHDIGALAVATCPEQSDVNQQIRCSQRYRVGVSYIVDVYDALPAKDVTTNVLYRNKFCALCNGVDIADIRLWTLRVMCQSTSNLNIATDLDLLNIVHRTPGCYFMFQDQDPEAQVETCSTAIATCNVTGAMLPTARFDIFYSNISQKCLTGETDAVKSANLKILYKNKYCLQCNSGSQSGVPPIDLANPLTTFSVLFAFDGRRVTSNVQRSKCASGTVFVQAKRQCVTARCSLLRQLRGNVCERTVPNPDRFAYRIGFRLTPQRAISVDNGYDIIPELGENIKNILMSVFPAVDSKHVLYEIVLVADKEYIETIDASTILQEDLVYYQVRCKFVNTQSHDPEENLIELIGLADETAFNISIGHHNISFRLMLIDDLVHFHESPNDFFPCSVLIDDFATCLFAKSVLKPYKAFHTKTRTVVPYIGQWIENKSDFFKTSISSERNILELRKCPLVKIERREVAWVETEQGIEFANEPLEMHVKSSEYVYGEDSDIIWICLETYENVYRSWSTSHADYQRIDLVLTVLLFSILICFSC